MNHIHTHTYNSSKYNLVLCEIHNRFIHGFDEISDSTVLGHYIVAYKFTPFNDDEAMYSIQSMYQRHYGQLNPSYLNHLFIRNYKQMIINKKYLQPEIAECVYLEGGECVAIIKTFWIRIIQRRWKKIMKERKQKLRKLLKLSNIKYREINGHYNSHFPQLKGMLSLLNSNSI